jgi:hypothetical protein
MNFDDWLNRAWDEHADDAAGVATRITTEGLGLAAGDRQLEGLARLAHHVYGDHLGRGEEGRALLRRIAAEPGAGEATRAAVRLYDASLALTADAAAAGLLAGLATSDRIRATALAASNLGTRDALRAGALLRAALAETEGAALADSDPALRALAACGNNLAVALEEKKAARSEDERALMILAARTGRECWGRAGTWLEIERAEYRLARSWLEAGDLEAARRHAERCLEIVREHADPALEAFFGWEALGRVEAAARNAGGHAMALAQARAAFERLEEGERSWCRGSLDALAAAAPG